MEDLVTKGFIFRIKKCAFDVISMDEDLINEDDEDVWWELIRRDLCLKSTFLYCDLNHVISRSCDEQKRTLTSIANRLFQYMEELDNAVKSRDTSLAQICHSDVVLVLLEVIAALNPFLTNSFIKAFDASEGESEPCSRPQQCILG